MTLMTAEQAQAATEAALAARESAQRAAVETAIVNATAKGLYSAELRLPRDLAFRVKEHLEKSDLGYTTSLQNVGSKEELLLQISWAPVEVPGVAQ